jgi:hypothetical protein
MNQSFRSVLAVATGALLSACAGLSSPGSGALGPRFSQDSLPDGVKVPAGHRVVMETVGVGEIVYECRAKADAAGTFEWVFVGPKADLNDRNGVRLGRYYGPPATWEANDGSRISGAQVAVAPGGSGNIPLQLVKASPAMGSGSMTGVSYIQRLATRGGVAPTAPCDVAGVGRKEIVRYQADYIFWKAA